MRDIPQSWIKNYVDQLLSVAKELPTGPLRDALLRRAECVMDLVEAWSKHGK